MCDPHLGDGDDETRVVRVQYVVGHHQVQDGVDVDGRAEEIVVAAPEAACEQYNSCNPRRRVADELSNFACILRPAII